MASKQRRRRVPQPNANCDAAKSNADGHVNDHTTSISYADGNRNDHTTSVSYANGDGDRFTHNKAYTDAKAAANAVPSSDAISEWAKRLKELQSNRELARQLASSLLSGECQR
jgi:hypothetical protein